ncbi:MAG: DNA polymerase III subunit beta [Betaproteobacteria bacterium]|nr:DNA polymerase III subunit beta [Betaproteobacteria bacterium]
MFTCPTEDFIKTLDKVIGAIERSTIQPILEHVLIEVADDHLTLIAADSHCHVRARLALSKGSRKGEQFCVAGSKLSSVLRSMISQSVSFRVAGSALHIQPAGAAKDDSRGFKLAIRPGEEFPRESVTHKPVAEIELEPARLAGSITRLLPAISNEIHRLYLTGMYFDFTGEALRLVATDGHRMAVDELAQIKTDKKFGIIVPRKSIDLLRRVLTDAGSDKLRLVALADVERTAAVRFEAGEVKITSVLVDATYPDYLKVIPDKAAAQASFAAAELRDVIGQVATVLDRGNDAITMALESGRASLSARGAQTSDEATLDMAADYSGESRTISFNGAYLTDMVKAFENREKISIIFPKEKESILCKTADAKEEDPLKYVLMPIKI